MKLFMLLSRVPYPLEKGDKLRAFHFIRLLAKKHDITLCALNEGALHPDAIPTLEKYCKNIHIINIPKLSILWNVGRALIDGKPLHLGYFWNLTVFNEIQKLIEEAEPDHIFCQLIRVADYVKHLEIPKTLDYQDVFSAGLLRRNSVAPFWMKIPFMIEYKRLRQYEGDIFPFFDHRMIISKPDRDLIIHNKNKSIAIVPNGVDTDYFCAAKQTPRYDLVFTGNMNYPPNIKCAEVLANEILPEVHKTIPNVTLVIAGANPSKSVQKLQSEFITVTGWVNDLRDYYNCSKIFIAPLVIGTGLQNKLLEAMAMQLPCITSPLANNALEAKENEDILIGRNKTEYASHIINLLKDTALANKIAQNGYQFIQHKYTWESVGEMIENIISKSNH